MTAANVSAPVLAVHLIVSVSTDDFVGAVKATQDADFISKIRQLTR
jgi:hypothetical protein